MDFLIDEYGQAIMLIIFGGGTIVMMGRLLAWVLSNGVIA